MIIKQQTCFCSDNRAIFLGMRGFRHFNIEWNLSKYEDIKIRLKISQTVLNGVAGFGANFWYTLTESGTFLVQKFVLTRQHTGLESCR